MPETPTREAMHQALRDAVNNEDLGEVEHHAHALIDAVFDRLDKAESRIESLNEKTRQDHNQRREQAERIAALEREKAERRKLPEGNPDCFDHPCCNYLDKIRSHE